IADGKIVAPAKSLEQMQRMVFNDYVDAALSGLFIFVVVSIVVYGLIAIARARRIDRPTVQETPYQAMPAGGAAAVTNRVH
ncbi:carbon starvation protein A, partial [Paraburkholderia sp. BR14261]